jgi:Flp pilus assembly protein TadG
VIRQRPNDEGQVLVLTGMLLTLLLVMAALVVDIGNAKQTGRNLQSAADSAALASAAQLSTSVANARLDAEQYAFDSLGQTRNNTTTTCPSDAPAISTTCYQSGNGPIVYVTTPWAATSADTTQAPTSLQAVNVKVCWSVATTFARVININTLRPCKSATADAIVTPSALPCAFCILNSSADNALQLGPKSDSKLAVTGGSGIVVNSSSSSAMQLGPKGSDTVTVGSPGTIGVVGGVKTGGNPTITPTPTTGVSPIPDPLAALPTPADRGSTTGLLAKGAVNVSTDTTIGPGIYPSIQVSGGTLTMSPGNYQINGALTVTSDGTLSMGAGVYVIKGAFTADRGGVINGTGVTVYFTCSGYPTQIGTTDSSCAAGSTGGYFSGTGGSSTTLSAPTGGTDPYNNLLMFYDRNDAGAAVGDCTVRNAVSFLDNGGSLNDTLTGTVYAKNATICMGGGIINANTLFVVNEFQIDDGAQVSANVLPSQQVSIPGYAGAARLPNIIG